MAERRGQAFLQAWTFFGLTKEYRLHLFRQIHEIVFHGKGGYTWDDVYNMPIWLRKFTYNNIREFYEAEKKRMEESSKQNKGRTQKPKGPDVKPSYRTKRASKQSSFLFI